MLPSGYYEVRARRCGLPHGNILRHMPTSGGTSHYALGNTDAEHERLIRQAAILAPLTERFFRQACIGPGQRVLDLGSGVGDVALLAAGLVGAAGGIQRYALPLNGPCSRLACPHPLCKWKFPCEIIPQPRHGSTICFALCCRKCSNSSYP